MGSKWKKYTIEELAAPEKNALSTGPFGSAISSKFFVSAGVPVIRGGNLSADTSSRMSDEGLVFVSNEKAIEFHRSIVKRDDLIFTCWGTINQVGLIDDSCKYGKYIISNKQMKITLDKGKAYPLFVYYLFSSPEKQREILKNGIGAAVPGFNLGQLKSHVVTLPSVTEQVKIADFINEFDKKITLNRQINQTLEQMAQALFKSWFVDFDPVVDNALDAGFFEQNSDLPEELLRRAEQRKTVREQSDFKPLPAETRQLFPAAFEECEEPSLGLGGWGPKGWRRQTLDKIAVLKTESVQPNKLPEVMWEHYSIPAFDAGKKPSNDIGESIKSGKYKIPSDCVLVSKLNPETRRVWLPKVCSDKYAVCSTEFMPFVPFDENYLAFLYCHLSSDNFQTDMCNRVSGTTGSHQRVKPKEVALMSLILPDVELINIFSVIVSPYLSRVQSVVAENDSLTRLRDTLLPKLISGELRLNDDGTLASGNTDC